MSKVRSRPESLVADCSMPALQPPEAERLTSVMSLFSFYLFFFCLVRDISKIAEPIFSVSSGRCQMGCNGFWTLKGHFRFGPMFANCNMAVKPIYVLKKDSCPGRYISETIEERHKCKTNRKSHIIGFRLVQFRWRWMILNDHKIDTCSPVSVDFSDIILASNISKMIQDRAILTTADW